MIEVGFTHARAEEELERSSNFPGGQGLPPEIVLSNSEYTVINSLICKTVPNVLADAQMLLAAFEKYW